MPLPKPAFACPLCHGAVYYKKHGKAHIYTCSPLDDEDNESCNFVAFEYNDQNDIDGLISFLNRKA